MEFTPQDVPGGVDTYETSHDSISFPKMTMVLLKSEKQSLALLVEATGVKSTVTR
jgi:hypothetical protein